MPRHQQVIDPVARARVLNQARELADELTAVCVRRADAFTSTGPLLPDSAVSHAALAETWEMLAQAVAFRALDRLAQMKFDSPAEERIVELIADDLVREVVGSPG